MNPQTPPCTHVNVRFLHGRFRLLEEEEEGRREGDSRKQVGGSEGLKDCSFRLVGASCLPPLSVYYSYYYRFLLSEVMSVGMVVMVKVCCVGTGLWD